jgi:hypothetical protein
MEEMDIKEIGCEVGKWMELVQDHVKWQALVSAVFNLLVHLSKS